MSNFYNMGSWGYMGVGPTPNRSFNLTVSVENNQYYYRWYSPRQVSKIGILLYKIGDTTKYAVHKTAYLTVTEVYGASFVIVSSTGYDQTEYGIPGSQTLDISYNESDWDFYGGFTADDLKGAAMCFFVKDPSGMLGSAPNGTDYASIDSDLAIYIDFSYTEIQERFASTIDGSNIYAKRAECDKDGNPINTTYAKKTELAGKQDTLTAGTNITIDSDGVISADGGDCNVFLAEYNVTPYADVLAAFNAGKDIFARYNITIDGSQCTVYLNMVKVTSGRYIDFGFETWSKTLNRDIRVMLYGYGARWEAINNGNLPTSVNVSQYNSANEYPQSSAQYLEYYDSDGLYGMLPYSGGTQYGLSWVGIAVKRDDPSVVKIVKAFYGSGWSATKYDISAGQTYTAGTGINIDSDGVISADLPEEEEVELEELDLDDYQKKLTEGTGIDIDSDGNISVDSSIATKSYVGTAVQGKQNALTGITDVQVVAALPGTPVATVLYLIPEA